MKRGFFVALVACVAMFVSCASVEDKAASYAKQMADAESFSDKAQVKEQMESYVKSLTPEEQVKFAAKFSDVMREVQRVKFDEITNGIKALFDEGAAMTDVVIEEIQKKAEEYKSENPEITESCSKIVDECLKAAEEAEKVYKSSGMEEAVNEATDAVVEEAKKAAAEAAAAISSIFE